MYYKLIYLLTTISFADLPLHEGKPSFYKKTTDFIHTFISHGNCLGSCL